jgi:hypothetical protein
LTQENEAISPIEDRGVLTGSDAIVSADPDLGVFGEKLAQLVQLEPQNLLSSKHIGSVVTDHPEHESAAKRPTVLPIVGGTIPQIETHDPKVWGAVGGILGGCVCGGTKQASAKGWQDLP